MNTLCFPMRYLSLRSIGRVPSKIVLTMSLLSDVLKENSGLYLENKNKIITNHLRYHGHSDNPILDQDHVLVPVFLAKNVH